MIDTKVGDVIGFSGRGFESDGINLATFGIPRWGISHVGIMGHAKHHKVPLLFESVRGTGVCTSFLDTTIKHYDGRVWVYSLSSPPFLHEVGRMSARLANMVGRDYDMRGAMRSGGRLWSWAQAVARGEDLTSLFCSERVAEILSYAGIFSTANASRWSPNHLVRTLRRLGIVNPPERLK